MNKHLKEILYVGLGTLMIASASVAVSNGYSANAARRIKSVRVYRHYNKNKKSIKNKQHNNKVNRRRNRKRINRTQNGKFKRYNHRIKALSHKYARKHGKQVKMVVLKSRFKRSNNKKLLKKSGFDDAQTDSRLYGADFVFSKYAPNDKRAVVPKYFNSVNWLKGKYGQKNPTAYQYHPELNGWVQVK